MITAKLTPEQRRALALAPLPRVVAGEHIPGKTWAGVLITHPIDLDPTGPQYGFDEETLAQLRHLIETGEEYSWLETLTRFPTYWDRKQGKLVVGPQ